jgi:hypothetical protein
VEQQNIEKVQRAAKFLGNLAELEEIIEELHAEKVQVEATLHGRIRELRCQCKKLHIILKEEHFHKEIANRYIEGLEKTVLEQEWEKGYVEAYYKCMINELCGKLRKTNRNKKRRLLISTKLGKKIISLKIRTVVVYWK